MSQELCDRSITLQEDAVLDRTNDSHRLSLPNVLTQRCSIRKRQGRPHVCGPLNEPGVQ